MEACPILWKGWRFAFTVHVLLISVQQSDQSFWAAHRLWVKVQRKGKGAGRHGVVEVKCTLGFELSSSLESDGVLELFLPSSYLHCRLGVIWSVIHGQKQSKCSVTGWMAGWLDEKKRRKEGGRKKLNTISLILKHTFLPGFPLSLANLLCHYLPILLLSPWSSVCLYSPFLWLLHFLWASHRIPLASL